MSYIIIIYFYVLAVNFPPVITGARSVVVTVGDGPTTVQYSTEDPNNNNNGTGANLRLRVRWMCTCTCVCVMRGEREGEGEREEEREGVMCRIGNV